MPSPKKHQIQKLADTQVIALRGHLMEIRKIGSKPIYVKVGRTDSIEKVLKNADIPSDRDVKVEGTKNGQDTWVAVSMKSRAIQYSKIAATTKVNGA